MKRKFFHTQASKIEKEVKVYFAPGSKHNLVVGGLPTSATCIVSNKDNVVLEVESHVRSLRHSKTVLLVGKTPQAGFSAARIDQNGTYEVTIQCLYADNDGFYTMGKKSFDEYNEVKVGDVIKSKKSGINDLHIVHITEDGSVLGEYMKNGIKTPLFISIKDRCTPSFNLEVRNDDSSYRNCF